MVDYLKEAHYFIPDLDGNVELDEAGLQTYRAVAQEPFLILFQAGYLTIKDYISDLRLYRLGFPNDEVRYGFLYNLFRCTLWANRCLGRAFCTRYPQGKGRFFYGTDAGDYFKYTV